MTPAPLTETERLRRMVDALQRLHDAQLTVAIAGARARGARWGEIGAALGIDGPQARERFGPLLEQVRDTEIGRYEAEIRSRSARP